MARRPGDDGLLWSDHVMSTFKTFAMYAGAVICLGGLIFAGIRTMSGRFHLSMRDLHFDLPQQNSPPAQAGTSCPVPYALLVHWLSSPLAQFKTGTPVRNNGEGNWWHNGSLPGTTTIMVRTSRGMCWAALTNTRSQPSSEINAPLDQTMWNTL